MSVRIRPDYLSRCCVGIGFEGGPSSTYPIDFKSESRRGYYPAYFLTEEISNEGD